MALILSAASGNFNAGATWVGGVVPGAADEARASTTHVVTITANVTCTEISNAGSGTFVLNSGVTLTANVTNKTTTANVNCLSFSAVSPATATIVGNVTGGAASNASPVAGTGAILNSSSGTLIVQGNVVGGTNVICMGAFNSSTGTISVTGNVTGGTGNTCYGIYNSSTGTISISGNVAGGSGATATGAINAAAGTLTITGNVSGGTISTAIGVTNTSTGTVTITSTTISGTVAIAVTNSVGGTVNITGNVTGGTAANIYGVSNAGVGTVNITGNVTGGTVVATSHGLNNASTGIVAIVGICTGGTAGAAGANNASTGTVRATRAVGNAYGPSNSAGLVAAVGISNVALGICEIEQFEFGTFGQIPVSGTGIRLKKAATNVAIFGYCDTAGSKTLIDATQNASMPAATDVRNGVSYASGALTGSAYIPASGSVAFGVSVDATTGTATLTPAAVWEYATRSLTTSSGATAAEIRAEMDSNSTKLANLDAAVSSRLAPSGTLAVVTTLTNAPGSVTPAQIRAEMDANSTKLANLDATVSSRLATSGYTAPTTPPTAAANATAVRTELSTELARVDAAVSTRLAGSAYTAPSNSDVTAIKAKTDLLETTRLAQCSTVATTGAQLAAALS